MWRGLDGVDIEVICQRMIHVEFQYGIEGCENFYSTRLRLAIRGPLVPRPQVHHRFSKKRAYIGIVSVGLPDSAHRVGVGSIQRTAILRLWISIATARRLDECVLHCRRV